MMSLKNLIHVCCQNGDVHIQQRAADYRWSPKCLFYAVFSDTENSQIYFFRQSMEKLEAEMIY